MSYSPEYFLARESWRDWRIEANELMRLARVQRDRRVLDIGCGGGGLLRLARSAGAVVVGADTLYTALKLAQRQEGEKVWENNSLSLTLSLSSSLLIQISADNHLPFAPNSFDTILGQHVIEHITNVDAALREWLRILKPGGSVAMATPNALYPDPAHFADADHAHIFSPNELRDAFTRAGFIVEHCDTVFALVSRPYRVFRPLGVRGYQVFRRVPYWATRGRTILISARKI